MTTIVKDTAAKLSVAFVAVAMIFSAFASSASAQTTEELQNMINDLLAQVASLQGQLGGDSSSAGSCVSIMAPLTIGSQGADVTALQNRLIADGQSIPAGATGYFGSQTQAALAAWQAANGVAPAVGYYGPITKASMDASCVAPGGDDMDDMDDMDDDSDMSLSGEGVLATFEIDDDESEVAEGAEEVVMILTLEAEDGDIEVSRMTFTLVADTAVANEENDPWDVFETVSLWVDGDRIAEFEADDEDNYLDEDAGEFRFSNLGLILEEDEEVEIMVSVEAMNSVDGSDVADAADWNIEPTQIRYFDADGVATTEDDVDEMDSATDDSVHFDIEEEGTDDGADVESNSSNPDAATLLVDEDNDDSDEFTVFIFDIEVDNDSGDLEVGDAFLDVTIGDITGGAGIAGGQEDVIDSIYMTIDGEMVEGEATINGAALESDAIAAAGSTEVEYLFEFDGDVMLEGDEDYEVEVTMVFKGQNSNYVNGTTVDIAVDGSTWEVEGAANDNELVGTDSSEQHTLATVVPIISDISDEASADDPNDSGRISFEFTIEADGENDIVGFDINDVITTLTSNAATPLAPTGGLTFLTGDATETAPGVWTINDNDEATFALDFNYTTTGAVNDGTYRVTLDSILGVEVDVTSDGLSLSF